jgi:hypothetical protein
MGGVSEQVARETCLVNAYRGNPVPGRKEILCKKMTQAENMFSKVLQSKFIAEGKLKEV